MKKGRRAGRGRKGAGDPQMEACPGDGLRDLLAGYGEERERCWRARLELEVEVLELLIAVFVRVERLEEDLGRVDARLGDMEKSLGEKVKQVRKEKRDGEFVSERDR